MEEITRDAHFSTAPMIGQFYLQGARLLSRSQYEQLDCQYANTPSLDDGFSASGEHYILVHLLNEFGYHPHSREEAFEITEKLLTEGWQQ